MSSFQLSIFLNLQVTLGRRVLLVLNLHMAIR